MRERASQFLQFTVERSFSKAYELVSPETKDWYLSSGKPQYTAFAIESIDYSKDFKKATVHSKVTRILSMNGREISTELKVFDLWQLEAGKWMWWHDPDVLITPFGEIPLPHNKPSANAGAPAVPRDTSPAAVQAAGSKVNVESSASKKELLFEQGTPGSDDFVFHNGLPGVVDVFVDLVGNYGAFTVEPAHVQMEGGKDLNVKVNYKPPTSPNAFVTPPSVFVRVTIQPFGRSVQLPLKFKNATP